MTDDRQTKNAASEGTSESPCSFCDGTGQEIVEHPMYGPQVTPCPDCDGTGKTNANNDASAVSR